MLKRIIRNSPYAPYIFATWACSKYDGTTEEHTRFTGILREARGKTCKCGRPLTVHHELDLELPALLLVGHPDLVFLINNKFYIHELKTWDRKDISFDDLERPIGSHRLQVSFYYKMMGYAARTKWKPYTVSRNLTVDYIDRGNSKLYGGNPYKALVIPPEPDQYLDQFRNRLEHVVVGLRTGKLPKRICTSINCTRARNCDLALECFARKGTHVENQMDNWGRLRIAEYGGGSDGQHGEAPSVDQHKDPERSARPLLRRPNRGRVLRRASPVS